MYANGNIALTDSNYEVLALLRSHQFEDDVAMKVGEIYPMAFATGSASSGTGTRQPAWILRASREEFVGWAVEKAREASLFVAVGDKKSKTRKLTLKQLLLSVQGQRGELSRWRDTGTLPFGRRHQAVVQGRVSR